MARALLRFAPRDPAVIAEGQAAVAELCESLRDAVAFFVGVELAAYDGAVCGQHSFGAFDHAAAGAFDVDLEERGLHVGMLVGEGVEREHAYADLAVALPIEGPAFPSRKDGREALTVDSSVHGVDPPPLRFFQREDA